ncbi:MAG: flagellar hook-basal body complex protein FliE [Planctomycetota bacterium]|nr:MAG: flagellar hook-basal body complex protein FliE [Planctomycetota bacterium]REJ94390.1 MAG: flagellar hook-basal body complex protein FliE [Planctomycetota bacterium]REK22077.1 MAG: flagellar hook-basal body complex protein FliE [Planctomycetota bacterium]REK44485.1 MAG: flagellar hook-basal body complex protein FliE [Planctomycetota bacterium]
MSAINGISPASISPGIAPRLEPATSSDNSFKNLLVGSIEQVNTMQRDADSLVEELITGGDVSPAEVLTAVQKADLGFRLMMQVRNKALQAFEEIRSIQI